MNVGDRVQMAIAAAGWFNTPIYSPGTVIKKTLTGHTLVKHDTGETRYYFDSELVYNTTPVDVPDESE